MKVSNMIGTSGREIPNQFIIEEDGVGSTADFVTRRTFQSYRSIIAQVTIWDDRTEVLLDIDFWDYSRTTGKYRNMFLGETKAETQKKIDSGEYKLVNLN